MKTAIVSLDIMNDLCHPDGKLAHHSERITSNHIIKHINEITAWGRQNNALIIHVRVGFNENYHEAPLSSPIFTAAKNNLALQLNTWGGQFCEALLRLEGDIEIIKHRVSAFYGTDLDLILRANEIKKLIITGFSTNMAVELTAREAHDRDYQAIVITDATECASDQEQAASINVLSRIASCINKNQLLTND